MSYREELIVTHIPEKTVDYFDATFPGLKDRLQKELFNTTLHQNSRKKNRKAPSIDERVEPCQLCHYPFSERHHLLDFSAFGETDSVVSLCPNCHQLYHIFWSGISEEDARSNQIIQTVVPNLPPDQFCGVMYLVFVVRDVFIEFIDLAESYDPEKAAAISAAFHVQMRLL